MIPLATYDALLLDLDGVVYRGAHAVGHAVGALAGAADAGLAIGFVTNNASRPPATVAQHLSELGVPCRETQVVTSAMVGAEVMAKAVPSGSRILAVGGAGVALALQQRGFLAISTEHERAEGRSDAQIAASVAGVLQGFGPDVRWRDLAVAAYAVSGGAVWVATNTDRTIPRADGIAPGNGTLVDAVTAATGVVPTAAGKPAAAMMEIAAEALGAARPLAVGDRLDTDIRGAAAAGIDSMLVLTGVSSIADVLDAPPTDRPTYIAADLRGLRADLPRLDDPTPQQEWVRLVRSCWSDAGVDRSRAAARVTELLAA